MKTTETEGGGSSEEHKGFLWWAEPRPQQKLAGVAFKLLSRVGGLGAKLEARKRFKASRVASIRLSGPVAFRWATGRQMKTDVRRLRSPPTATTVAATGSWERTGGGACSRVRRRRRWRRPGWA